MADASRSEKNQNPAPRGRTVPVAPLNAARLIDLDFLSVRNKLLDITAFLDRLDRADAQSAGDAPASADDFRIRALREAMTLAASDAPDKTRTVQMIFSDPTDEPLESAVGMKGATGAWPGGKK